MSRPEIERVFRAEWGGILATLIRGLGDFDRAEEALQEAFTVAVERWEADGVPDTPAAWLLTVARRKAIDHLRRERTRQGSNEALEGIADERSEALAAIEARLDHSLDDDPLRLIFTCCHPSLAREAQVALTLRTLGGLTTEEIARAFLVPRETMQQRLVRAKKKIREARIPYRIPGDEVLPERIPAVLAVIYLIFNEGYAASSGDQWIRGELCEEALRLARILVTLLPQIPEIHAQAALLCLQHSRQAARVAPDGTPILLEDQDRELWDAEQIAEGRKHLSRARTWATRTGRVTSELIQAEIAAVHARAREPAETEWRRIVRLYDTLLEIHPSSVVALNRAAALAMAEGPEVGLRELDRVATEAGGALDRYRYPPLSAGRASSSGRSTRRGDGRLRSRARTHGERGGTATSRETTEESLTSPTPSPGLSAAGPNESAPRGRRLRRKLLRGCLIVGFVGLTLLAALLIYMLPGLLDDPPYNAPDLIPQRAPVPQEGNFALFLAEWDGVEEFDDLSDLLLSFEEAHYGGNLDEFLASEEGARFLSEYWGPMEELLTRVEVALELPHCEFPPLPKSPLETDSKNSVPAMRTIARGFWVQLILAARESPDAYDAALRNSLRCSTKISAAKNASMGDCMIRTSIVWASLAYASAWLQQTDSPVRIRRIADQLREIELDPQLVSQAIREEYAQFRYVVENFWEISELEGDPGPRSRRFFLPQRTLAIVGEHYRAAIAEGEQDFRVTAELPMDLEPSPRSLLREGNSVGRSLVGIMLIMTSTPYKQRASGIALLDLTRLQFALRTRELETGSLPPTLDALVPEFFAEIPIDPFSKKPYRYDSARRIVWGVGSDRVDDGGITEENSYEPDITLEIPGGP